MAAGDPGEMSQQLREPTYGTYRDDMGLTLRLNDPHTPNAGYI